MHRYLFILAVAALLFNASCRKKCFEGHSNSERLVFGSFYGMCPSGCAHLYEISGNTLTRDDSAKYYPVVAYVATTTLDTARMLIARPLLSAIPTELTLDSFKVLGCPDCHDQGMLYVEVTKGGITHKYVIDRDHTSDQSAAVIRFKNQIDSAINQIGR